MGVGNWLSRLFDTGDYTRIVMGVAEEYAYGRKVLSGGVIEACAGVWGRAFASSNVEADVQYLTRVISPSILNRIGRDLLIVGESLWLVDGGGRVLAPVNSHNVKGSYNPDSWEYILNVAGPSDTLTNVRRSATDVLHFRINESAIQPWAGRSPLSIGTRVVADALETYLDREMNQNSSQAFIRPDSEDAASESDLKQERVERLSTGFGDQRPIRALVKGGPDAYKRIKFGPEVASSVVSLRNQLETTIIAAAGIPPGLLLGAGGGTATREDFRRLFALTIQPISRIVQNEFRSKIHQSITIDSGVLARDADIASKARGVQSQANAAQILVGLGIPNEQALEMVGLRDEV